MSILNIRQAIRTGSKVVIGLSGISGSGKTYTALKMARGMVNQASEIGFLDTENRRGSLYADILDGQFLIGDLFPPFSPSRYAAAIKEFQDAGVKVLVIDSVTHEWEGDGGCDDIAQAPIIAGKRMANWKGAKKEHKHFMNSMLQCDMHIIACIRAREKTDFSNPKSPKSMGVQPVTEKNFMFEMTASMMLWDEGKAQQFTKMPEALRSIFGNGDQYLDESHGRALIEWVNTGEKVDVELERFKSAMQMATQGGIESLKSEWLKMPTEIRKQLNPSWKNYESAAIDYDSMIEQQKPEAETERATKGFNPAKQQPIYQEPIYQEPIQQQAQIKEVAKNQPEQNQQQNNQFNPEDF